MPSIYLQGPYSILPRSSQLQLQFKDSIEGLSFVAYPSYLQAE